MGHWEVDEKLIKALSLTLSLSLAFINRSVSTCETSAKKTGSPFGREERYHSRESNDSSHDPLPSSLAREKFPPMVHVIDGFPAAAAALVRSGGHVRRAVILRVVLVFHAAVGVAVGGIARFKDHDFESCARATRNELV